MFTPIKPYTQKQRVEYCALRNAIHRCTVADDRNYKNYGARGITVHAEWMEGMSGFEKFFAEIGPRPSPEYSLDRIDNNRGYEPGNIRWATITQQMKNRRYTGDPDQRQQIDCLAKMAGISVHAARHRVLHWDKSRWMEPQHHSNRPLATKRRSPLVTADKIDWDQVAENVANLPKARLPERHARNNLIRARFKAGDIGIEHNRSYPASNF
ncbi:MAG: hypothetical protein EOO77_14750 [Oxalobacteraceae bacterium]|nr:MAG: hypothetical protein EOO77_14750 [Oxalobacteraceae bacterium]